MIRIAPILLMVFIFSRTALAQGLVDLVEGNASRRDSTRGPIEIRSRIDRGRLDLQLSPNVQSLAGEPAHRSVNLGASLQWNPVCGKFDVRADFEALFGKEAREEYLRGALGAVTSEILGSATELFCQAQPTACSIAMNNNLAANLKLLYTNDLCQTWEQAVHSGAKRGRAEVILRCMERKQKEGKTKDQAEKACLNENPEVTGFDGRAVEELDLNREIRRFLTFSDGGSEFLDGLTQGRRVGRSAITEEPRPNAVAERYEKTREEYRKRWAEALGAAKEGSGAGKTASELTALVPPGAPPITKTELELLAKRPEGELAAFLGSVSAAAALLRLTREMNEVERKLEALKDTPALEDGQEHKSYLEGLVLRIRSERERMLRLYADEERLGRVLGAGHALGQAEIIRTRVDVMRRAAVSEAAKNILIGTRPFGSPETMPPPSPTGAGAQKASATKADCGNCGLEYSIGTGGGRP